MPLSQFGWDDHWEALLAATPAQTAGRVIASHSDWFTLATEAGETVARPAGRLEPFPVVGDWVATRDGAIANVLPRRTLLRRKASGPRAEPQALAANIDVIFVVSGLDDDFNLRRLERYVVIANDSGAACVFVLNKADLHEQPEGAVKAVMRIAGDRPVVSISAGQGTGIESLSQWLQPNRTGVLIGSSGAGKSTLLNRLLGSNIQAEGAAVGLHTTKHRQMFRLPNGALLIDSPGIREIQLWVTEDAVVDSFTDIADLAAACRFRDCRHENEPGCAVRDNTDADRLGSLGKLRKEAAETAATAPATTPRRKPARTQTKSTRQLLDENED